MSKANLVRYSRDGDQFHYLWAARRCLLLISPDASLKAITIEGPSLNEVAVDEQVTVGDELIDIGEYYGSEDIKEATLIRYIQVKHSTVRTDKVWTMSELEKTLKGFAERYEALQQQIHIEDLGSKLEFWFVSNRPISTEILEVILATAEGMTVQNDDTLKKLEKITGFKGERLATFCKQLRLEGNHEGLWDQQNLLSQDTRYYLVDSDTDAPLQLKELVTRKALSACAGNPSITRIDVLRALKTDESCLFPAPCLIQTIENELPREQESEFIKTIVQSNSIPVIIHAAGGVGKSVFATHINSGLPVGSASILYDCFGNGQYRSVSGYRHRHKDSLVQIANELAAKGLCHPIIPNPHSEPSAYVKAFIYRLSQSISSLRSRNPQALLCIIVDAADNAQMAAKEIGETRSFIRDLIREQLPEGVRLIALCRTHRVEDLDAPPDSLLLELKSFSRDESASYLRSFFADVTDQDVEEFHRLSSQNPRVQALALSRKIALDEILRSLGPNPTTVEDTIRILLDKSIARLRDVAGGVEKNQIDKICAGLAALRPLLPLSVLSVISGVDETAIKSFAYDLGRPLLVTGSMIQFLDEPAETWFKERFKPTAADLVAFITSLKPLAANSAYVASTLPQLMLEAGQLTELIALALSSEVLPNASPVEKRDIELQRLQFALKASLRAKRYTDATKLALKAGGESAGDERQRKLLQTNTDLAAKFFVSDRVQELVSRKMFGSGWMGSHHAYEAAILSEKCELLGDARSRLRMAHEWLRNWSQLPETERRKEKITDEDILEMTIASFNIFGPDACAYELRRWRPRQVSFRVGRILARKFIDHGRYEDLDKLLVAAGNDVCLILAITLELSEVQRVPQKPVVQRAFRMISNFRIKLTADDLWDSEGVVIRAVTAFVEAAYKLSIGSHEAMIAILTHYLPKQPPRSLSSRHDMQRFPVLRAYALRAELKNQSLDIIDLAYDGLRQELEQPDNVYSRSQDAREFKENIGSLLPWHILWAKVSLGRISAENLSDVIDKAKTSSFDIDKMSYREWSDTNDEIARVWFDILLAADSNESALVDDFDHWSFDRSKPLFTTTLTHIARRAARSSYFEARALDYASKAYVQFKNEHEDAESKSIAYVQLSRAIMTVSQSEAVAYFNQAVEVASKIGEENLDRWGAFLDLANRAATKNRPAPIIAYRFARCAELTYEYVDRDKHFNWDATVEAISALCGNSSFAILSRWRDRKFGRMERLLPIAVNFLVSRGDLDPKVALALICFRAEWEESFLLKNVLAVCTDQTERAMVADFAYHYMALNWQNAEMWRGLKSLLSEYHIVIPKLDEWIAFSEREEQNIKPGTSNICENSGSNCENGNAHFWDEIFEDIDLCSSNDISSAYRRFKESEPPYYIKQFILEANRRVEVGKVAEYIRAISDVSVFDLYELRNFLEIFPKSWLSLISVKPALTHTIKSFCRRFCMEITKSRSYEVFPLKIGCELAQISEVEVIDEISDAIGEVAEIADTYRLFTLTGLLASKLTENEALEALSFGLDIFDPILEDSDGDGPWSTRFEPPAMIEGSVAGYVWGCLAAPQASLRWEAVHVVRAICTLGQEKVLENLVELAKGVSADAFHDSGLMFYKLHARQWLLIALARVAIEHPMAIAPYADFLFNSVFDGEPHVLIREFAKKTLLALLDAGCVVNQDDVRFRLIGVNTSPFPPVFSRTYNRIQNKGAYADAAEATDSEKDVDRYYFGIDMGPYWFAPLGRCFAKPQSSIEREAFHVIRNDWSLSVGSGWDEDERQMRKIFKDMETQHSHGSYPSADNQSFYLSYHAMMVVAGKLLATTPVHYDHDDSYDGIQQWLHRHSLTRNDGKWLADRRDPIPLERPVWKDQVENKEWIRSITSKDFDNALVACDGTLNLWGTWTWSSGHREESVYVNSALVSPERSMALLRALHCTDNPSDYRIPDAEDDLQIDFNGFQLKGWIVSHNHDSGIDERDPWAGTIRYPLPEPSPSIIDLMSMSSDVERRRWFVLGEDIDVAWSQTWGGFREADDETNCESGERFQASYEFIISMIKELKMDLVVEIQMRRSLHYSRWERMKDDDTGYTPPSARIFLIKSDGRICTL